MAAGANPDIREDKKFEKLVPKPQNSERRELQRSILAEGLREPLVAWRPPGEEDEPPVLLDGHNRYRICRDHGVDYQVRELEFASREEAEAWILVTHLGRRNLTMAGRCEVALNLEPRLRDAASERQRQAGKKHGRGSAKKLPPEPAEAIGAGDGSIVDSLLRAHSIKSGQVRVQAAKIAGIGKTTLDNYKTIKDAAKVEEHSYAKELLDDLQGIEPSTSINRAFRDLKARREWEKSEAEWEAEETEDEEQLNGSDTWQGRNEELPEGDGSPTGGGEEVEPESESAEEEIDGIPTRVVTGNWDRRTPVWSCGEFGKYVEDLDDNTVKLLLTDPPYGAKYGRSFWDDSPEDAADDLREMLRAFEPKLKPDAHVVFFCGLRQESLMREVLEEEEFSYLTERDPLVWVKNKPGEAEAAGSVLGDHRSFAPAYERAIHAVKGDPQLRSRQPIAYIAPRIPASTRGHETEKPVGMLRQIIEATTGFGGIVADPFGGVASTLEAALRCERRAWGCEKNANHHISGSKRLNAVIEELSGLSVQIPLFEMVLQQAARAAEGEPAPLEDLPDDPLGGVPYTIWGFGEPPEEMRREEVRETGVWHEGYYIRFSDPDDGPPGWYVYAEFDDPVSGERFPESLGVFNEKKAEEAVREHARARGESSDVYFADPVDDSYYRAADFWDE